MAPYYTNEPSVACFDFVQAFTYAEILLDIHQQVDNGVKFTIQTINSYDDEECKLFCNKYKLYLPCFDSLTTVLLQLYRL